MNAFVTILSLLILSLREAEVFVSNAWLSFLSINNVHGKILLLRHYVVVGVFYYLSMTWKEFQQEKKAYQAVWKKIKDGAKGALAVFLEQSYLVVSCGRQFKLEADIPEILKECPAFFIDDLVVQQIKKSISLHELPETYKNGLPIVDSWRIEIRFPYVDIDFIQELKASPYCDQEKTMIRPSSTTVVLRKDVCDGKKEQ